MKAKRRVTTARDVRAGGKRTPTVRKIKPLIGSNAQAVTRTRPPVSRSARVEAAAVAAAEPIGDAAVDLSVDLGRGLVLQNPILVASGTLGYGIEYGDVVAVDRPRAICCTGTALTPGVGHGTTPG